MKKKYLSEILIFLILPFLFSGCLLQENRTSGKADCILKGTVRDSKGPVSNAIVRIQTTDTATVSDENGNFFFRDILCNGFEILTAWAPGYYITLGAPPEQKDQNRTLFLTRHTDTDNPNYKWLHSVSSTGEGENQACAECHSSESAESKSSMLLALPVDQWLLDAHSQSALNPRFLSIYFGTDIKGNISQPTRYIQSRDYGKVPIPPESIKNYYGPGYKLDFPDSQGNCGSCHIPIAALIDPYGVEPYSLERDAAEGISCDFCHKIYNVKVNEKNGLPRINMPGILSIEFRRPEDGHQLFMGPLDDVAPGEDSYLPLQKESLFCAPCHFAVFWDTPIYNSFGEWLESPYSNSETGKTCQDCHMPRGGEEYFVLPEKGGLKRNPKNISSHLMPGSMDKEFLENSVSMTVAVNRDDDQTTLSVSIINDKTGHHVPTDSPLRHLILTVKADDGNGNQYPLIEGTTLPDWTGTGRPENGNYAGIAGKVYAKVLEELWTGISPSGAYWNQTRIISDNRIGALENDSSTYIFQTGSNEVVNIEVILLYRRAYKSIMENKGWNTPDIVMKRYNWKSTPVNLNN